MAETITLEIPAEEAAALEFALRKLHDSVAADAEQARLDQEEITRLKLETLQLKEETRRIAESTRENMLELETTLRSLLPTFKGFAV